jgi:hypothetical protein
VSVSETGHIHDTAAACCLFATLRGRAASTARPRQVIVASRCSRGPSASRGRRSYKLAVNDPLPHQLRRRPLLPAGWGKTGA